MQLSVRSTNVFCLQVRPLPALCVQYIFCSSSVAFAFLQENRSSSKSMRIIYFKHKVFFLRVILQNLLYSTSVKVLDIISYEWQRSLISISCTK